LNFPEFSYFSIIKKVPSKVFQKFLCFGKLIILSASGKLFSVVCENFCFGWQIWLLERVENNSFGRSANFLTNKYVFYVLACEAIGIMIKFMKLNFDGKINKF
jgi:hypothetical protein